MRESIFSEHWYRVSGLHPRVRSHVRIERHCYRGEVWHVLKDRMTSRQHRVNDVAWRIVGRLDGRHSVQDIWTIALDELGDDAPTQHEVIELLAQLHSAELIATEASADVAALFDRRDARQRQERRQRMNPLSFKVGLFDPSAMLEATAGIGRLLARPVWLGAWAMLVVAALVAAGSHAGELRAYANLHLATPSMLLMMWLCYPLVKAVHEYAHAMAVHTWGGEVHEMGVTLLALIPVPFVDASAASGFRERHRRILVSLAGVIAELLLAAFAMFVWLQASDGALRQAAFAVMLIGSVSTLMFNGNPLMRFDAYYALADALEIPGLAPRSRAYLRWIAERRLLGSRAPGPTIARGERRWLLGYGVAAAVYRWVVALAMLLWLSDWSLLLGVLLGLAMAWQMLAKPLLDLARHVATSPGLASVRARAIGVSLGSALALAVGLFVVPVPFTTQAPGVVWVPEQAKVRAEVDGFVDQVLAVDGQAVRVGEPIVQLREPRLAAEWARTQARLAALDATYQAALRQHAAEARQVAEEIERVRSDARLLLERLGQLTVRSPAMGTLSLPRPQDLDGRYVAKGSLIAHALAPNRVRVRVALDQDEAGLVSERTVAVSVRLAENAWETLDGRLVSQTPSATRELPSAALGDRGGGPFLTDPSDTEGLRLVESVFLADVELPSMSLNRLGGRVWVRFDHGAEPIGVQAWRRVRLVFLRLLGGERALEARTA